MYNCPKDGEKLKWKQFLTTGRWHCKKCDGTLAFKKHLKKLSLFHEFEHSLSHTQDQEKIIKCPICLEDMSKLRATASRRSCIIDICHECQTFWFDPNEFRLVEDTGQRSKRKEDEKKELPGQVIEFGFDEFFEVKDYSRYVLIFKILFIVFNLFLVLTFIDLDGNMDVLARLGNFHRMLDPLGFAILGTLFSFLYGYNSERYLWMLFPGLFCTLASLLVWVSTH